MASREEIREGAEEIISDCVYGLAKAPMFSEDIVKELFSYLDSVGVVIKVERDLPSVTYTLTAGNTPDELMVIEKEYRKAYAGYAATEPLR